ncbi:aminoglycoside phosphotransferase [Trichoderma arundinaceum]|uniref:Aminoglycoside phosphotransferase n=1 Tax=Trichoderma arundinaceum TaxID=490622 RepID=A0A395P1C4_TRIAR|nr:aminoglycoside phosphotransferase [Trichoderma arundinaceum]
MGTPRKHLPPAISEDAIRSLIASLNLPSPQSVSSFSTAAEYHSIYVLSFTPEAAAAISPKLPPPSNNECIQLILRIAGHHLPRIKTINEVAVMTWCVSGLQFDRNGDVIPGPVIEETFWHGPDVSKYWPNSESVQTLNISGPYNSYTDYIIAMVRVYQHAIRLHPSLEGIRDLLPRLDAFADRIYDNSELNNTRYFLAHKDLHFGNIMCDEVNGHITGILDWEFSGVVPATRWDPVKAFLWNGQYSQEAIVERGRVGKLFEERCTSQGFVSFLDETKPSSALQKAMQEAINYLRAIVEVCPRGQKVEKVPSWRASLEHSLEFFGV